MMNWTGALGNMEGICVDCQSYLGWGSEQLSKACEWAYGNPQTTVVAALAGGALWKHKQVMEACQWIYSKRIEMYDQAALAGQYAASGIEKAAWLSKTIVAFGVPAAIASVGLDTVLMNFESTKQLLATNGCNVPLPLWANIMTFMKGGCRELTAREGEVLFAQEKMWLVPLLGTAALAWFLLNKVEGSMTKAIAPTRMEMELTDAKAKLGNVTQRLLSVESQLVTLQEDTRQEDTREILDEVRLGINEKLESQSQAIAQLQEAIAKQKAQIDSFRVFQYKDLNVDSFGKRISSLEVNLRRLLQESEKKEGFRAQTKESIERIEQDIEALNTAILQLEDLNIDFKLSDLGYNVNQLANRVEEIDSRLVKRAVKKPGSAPESVAGTPVIPVAAFKKSENLEVVKSEDPVVMKMASMPHTAPAAYGAFNFSNTSSNKT